MTTLFRRKQYRRNPHFLVLFCRRIGYARYYRRNGMSWLEAWDIAGKVL